MTEWSRRSLQAHADRLAADGWSTFTRTLPADTVETFGEASTAVALTWIRRQADLVGHDVLEGSAIMRDTADGGLRVSILARPRVRLDPDPRYAPAPEPERVATVNPYAAAFAEGLRRAEPEASEAARRIARSVASYLAASPRPVRRGPSPVSIALVIGGVLILVAIILVLAAR